MAVICSLLRFRKAIWWNKVVLGGPEALLGLNRWATLASLSSDEVRDRTYPRHCLAVPRRGYWQLAFAIGLLIFAAVMARTNSFGGATAATAADQGETIGLVCSKADERWPSGHILGNQDARRTKRPSKNWGTCLRRVYASRHIRCRIPAENWRPARACLPRLARDGGGAASPANELVPGHRRLWRGGGRWREEKPLEWGPKRAWPGSSSARRA